MMIYDLLIFTQYSKAYAPVRLAVEAKNMDLRYKIYEYGKIKNIAQLPMSKSVILREPNPKLELYKLRDKLLRFYLPKSYILNHRSYITWSVLDKKTQSMEFKKGNIPHIRSLKLQNSTPKAVILTQKFPIIAKAILGSHGDHVYKINNKKELKEVLEKYGKDHLIFQEFLKSGFDLRVIVIDFKVIGIMKRTPRKGEFLSNFSQGGKVEEYNGKDKSDIEKISIQAAKHFKLDYVGVDIMKSNTGKWKVLEVNRACQFKGFEKVTNVNVAKEILNIFYHFKNPDREVVGST